MTTARRCARYTVKGLEGSFEVATHADLLNIGLLGVSVRSPVALDVDEQVAVDLGSEPLSVSGAIRWCRAATLARGVKAGGRGHFDVGISFSESLTSFAADLLRFLDNSTILSLTKGTYGRFELAYEVPVRLRYRRGFQVKQLSCSGMLIETDAPVVRESHIDLQVSLRDRQFFSRARVVWVGKAGHGKEATQLGVEYFQPTEHNIELLRGYLREEFEH